MALHRQTRHALYLAWKLDSADDECAGRACSRLTAGERRFLYRLRSWAIVNGEAQVLLAPEAPLEEIVEAILPDSGQPTSSRWVEGRRACAIAVREIETVPVRLGVAIRPEQWPFSSASME
jgi:hypothetical protein